MTVGVPENATDLFQLGMRLILLLPGAIGRNPAERSQVDCGSSDRRNFLHGQFTRGIRHWFAAFVSSQ